MNVPAFAVLRREGIWVTGLTGDFSFWRLELEPHGPQPLSTPQESRWTEGCTFCSWPFSDDAVRGENTRRWRLLWFDPRTEGCGQAYGVFGSTMVPYAKVRSRNQAVNSVHSSDMSTPGHPRLLQSTQGFRENLVSNRPASQSLVAVLPRTVHKLELRIGRSFRGSFQTRAAP
jgi:hypothetical protein